MMFSVGHFSKTTVTFALQAEEIVAQMISSERLSGHIDQLEGFVHFERKSCLLVGSVAWALL